MEEQSAFELLHIWRMNRIRDYSFFGNKRSIKLDLGVDKVCHSKNVSDVFGNEVFREFLEDRSGVLDSHDASLAVEYFQRDYILASRSAICCLNIARREGSFRHYDKAMKLVGRAKEDLSRLRVIDAGEEYSDVDYDREFEDLA